VNNQTELEQFKTAAKAAWVAAQAARAALAMALQAALAAVEVEKLPIKQKIRRVRMSTFNSFYEFGFDRGVAAMPFHNVDDSVRDAYAQGYLDGARVRQYGALALDGSVGGARDAASVADAVAWLAAAATEVEK
jgi:hypothetical protein